MNCSSLRFAAAACLSLAAIVSPSLASDDSPVSRYYEQLRRRGFYRLAETHAESRLADPLLTPEKRTTFVIELSRTLAAHAISAADDQKGELWDKAALVLAEEISIAGNEPRRILLETYAGLVPAAHAEDLVWDVESAPFDDPVRESLERTSQQALTQLSQVEKALAERLRTLSGKKPPDEGVPAHELRSLLAHVRLKQGFVLQAKARLSPAGSADRHSDLLDADEQFRQLIHSPSDEISSQAKLGLAIGNRLRDEHERALEMLDALAKERRSPGDALVDAARLERARVLLTIRRPDDAAKTLLEMQVGRTRLSGEYWLTYLQTLAALRRIAADRRAETILADLQERAEAALKSVDEQAGGAWSRRCRAVWSAAESVARYGQQVTAYISRGKSEYLAGRNDTAIAAYASALELAQQDGQTDLEMEVGFTLAAILAKAGRWDETARRCGQLVSAHPEHARAPSIDLLRLHALGMLYDGERTAERKTDYEQALAAHVERFPQSPTLSEAEFLRGRLWESAGQIDDALAAFQRVPSDAPRGPEAAAAVARCTAARLLQQRDAETRDAALEHQALRTVMAQLREMPDNTADWTEFQIETVYHGIRVLLVIEPPRCADAERWLQRLETAIGNEPAADEDRNGMRAEIARRIGPLRLIALAGQGRPQEAERLLGTLEQSSPQDMLAVVEELSQIEIPSPAAARRSLIEMQLATAERLNQRRSDLTDPQQRRLAVALAKSYFATGQPKKAIATYERLLDDHPRDLELARRLGRMLLARAEPESLGLARTCWRRVESSSRQGSPEWLDARAWVIDACLKNNDRAEARKLLTVTKLLYGKSWDEALTARYAELERQLK